MTLKRIPIDTVKNYVFPGGQTLTFKNVGFSSYQDLTALISYADPSKPVATVTAPKTSS